MKTFTLLLGLSLALVVGVPLRAQDAKPKRKVLFLTKSAGFMHDVVNRKKACVVEKGKEKWSDLPEPAALSYAEQVLTEIAKTSGAFEVTCTQNPADVTAESLKGYDAVFFYTTQDLGWSPDQKKVFLDWLASGKALIGSHCATDTFYNWKEYGQIIGGYFDGHPWHERVKVKVEDPKHPACQPFDEVFGITDEIYQFRSWSRDKVHVIMSLDASNAKTKKEKVKNADGTETETEKEIFFSKGKRKDNDYAIAWTNTYEKGRIFYTALGHRGDVWGNEKFQKHVLNGILWAMGDLK